MHFIWCVIIIYINGTKLNFVATDMKSQAYAQIWLKQGRDFLASGSRGVSGTQTINNDFQLSDFVSGVRI